jgi:hypothetical protein
MIKKEPVRLTWGSTGRGESKTATVYCPDCREVVARDVPVFKAREVVDENVHFCPKPATD